MNSKEFSLIVEQIKKEKTGISYMDAIHQYSQEHKIEPDTVGKLISKPLKEKISVEAQSLNLIRKTGALPL